MDNGVGQRKHSTSPLRLSGEKKQNVQLHVLEDRGHCEGQGSLPTTQPELSASSGGTEGSIHPDHLELLSSTTSLDDKCVAALLRHFFLT